MWDVKKIIHFSLANNKGGITQYVLNNWKFIDKTKFQFDMVTFGESLDFQSELEEEGCNVFYVKNRAEYNLKKFQNEILRIFSNGYDIAHLHTSYWKSFELEKLAKQVGIPRVIVHSHNTEVFDDIGREEKKRQHYNLLSALTPDIATDFWACSRAAAKWLYADKIPEERIRIVNNAIDVNKFTFSKQKRKEYRERLGWGDKFIIGHVGRFSYQKNHEFLIDVFKDVAKENKNVRLLLIGKGPLEKNVDSLIKRYGLIDKVYFAGTCNDVDGWLQAMDMFALPSRFEGLPIVAVEAQTAGLKCVCSDTITEEIVITENIELVPLQIEVWVDEILKIVTSAEKGNYRRNDMSHVITGAGYNILSQIQMVENYYDKT